MREKLLKFIIDDNPVFDVANLDDYGSLFDQGLDSLSRITLFFKIEEEYGIVVTDSDIEKLKSLIEIITFIKSRTAQ